MSGEAACVCLRCGCQVRGRLVQLTGMKKLVGYHVYVGFGQIDLGCNTSGLEFWLWLVRFTLRQVKFKSRLLWEMIDCSLSTTVLGGGSDLTVGATQPTPAAARRSSWPHDIKVVTIQ